jgi:hypothetical protein
MRNSSSFVLPGISEDDIAWACDLLGVTFDDARKAVLFANESIDVAACPGSGKTTLLVAKLAILARGWTDRRRGICVLSHTNAARDVIEERLGSTAVGQALLSYPHYIGTIHGFVDRFLGVPWIKASGFPVLVIDTDIALTHRWKLLPYKTRGALENKRNGPGVLKLVGPDFSLGSVGWGKGGQLGLQTDSYKNMVSACRKSAEAGCFCYEDPFLWGKELADSDPRVVASLRDRFPMLFIDEAQDNSELQSSILHKIFADVDAESSVICQRFGDANQAIYHGVHTQDTATTWVFPVSEIKHDVPDSHRFGNKIASFAKPLAVEQQDLTGRGPDQRKVKADVDDQHTIFLFDDSASKDVLPAYSRHLKNIFDASALEAGSFIAVGAKHKEPDNDKNKPNSVCDYWRQYAPKQAKVVLKSDHFIEFFQTGRSQYQKDTEGNLHNWVEQVAAGLLEAVRISKGKLSIRQRKNCYVKETLQGNPKALQSYTEFVRRFVVDQERLSKQLWDREFKHELSEVAIALWLGDGECLLSNSFFEWPDEQEEDATLGKVSTVYQDEGGFPKIRLGSIHSVKGETHTGVLILETFNRSYNLAAVKDWLVGKKSTPNKRRAKSSKLKVHYVAMTRPTHLLCLALPSGTFSDAEVTTLQERGWRIERIPAISE